MNANPDTIDRAIKRTEARMRLLEITPTDKRVNPRIGLTREASILSNLKRIRETV